jgi:hypothetical protein
MKNVPRYDVFISYSHADKQFALRLETALRKYRPPFKSGLTPKRLAVFRDESEASGTILSEGLDRAIAASRKLLVICSPSAYESRWVGQEIGLFIKKHGVTHVIPVLTAGMPNDEALRVGRKEDCAFPPSLSEAMQDAPWSPDFRDHRQGFRSVTKVWPAWFHLLAAIYDVPREVLEQKERIRRIYRTAAGVAVVLLISIAGWNYQDQRNQTISL